VGVTVCLIDGFRWYFQGWLTRLLRACY